MIRTFLFITLVFLYWTLSSQDFWHSIPYPDSTEALAMNVERSDYIFFSTNWTEPRGIYRTNKEIINWEFSNTGYIWTFDIAFDNLNSMYLASSNFILKSEDFGITFDTILSGVDNIVTIEIDEDDGVWAGTWGAILHSSNNGLNWDTVLSVDIYELFEDIAFGTNGEIYSVSTHFTAPAGGFYRSMDSGITWENTGLSGENAHSLAVNPYGEIFVGCYFTGVFRSTDIGITWTHVKNDIDAASIVIDSENKIYCANAGENWVNNQGIYSSDDNGDNWDLINQTGLLNKHVLNLYLDSDDFLYVLSHEAYGHQLYKSNNPVVGINEIIKEPSHVHLFPNPCQNSIKITYNIQFNNEYYYEIVSINGYILQVGKLTLNNYHQDQLDVSSIPYGLYILYLHNKNHTESSAILFEKK